MKWYILEKNITPHYTFTVTTKILNEAHNLEEWYNHYIKLGCEQFYIYIDDKSIDKNDVKRISSKYSKLVTLITWPFHHGNCTEHKFGQIGQINHCVYKYGRSCDWLFIGDVDEYIVPHVGITNFINDLSKYNTNVSVLKLQTYWFGGDEIVEKWDTNKTTKYLYRKSRPEGIHNRTKCIVKPNKIKLFNIHNPMIYDGQMIDVSVDKCQINHYYNFSNWQKRDVEHNFSIKDTCLCNI